MAAVTIPVNRNIDAVNAAAVFPHEVGAEGHAVGIFDAAGRGLEKTLPRRAGYREAPEAQTAAVAVEDKARHAE